MGWCFNRKRGLLFGKKDKHDDPHRQVNVVTDSGKQLVWFFFRIVFVFCLIWLPAMGMMVVGYSDHDDKSRCGHLVPRLTIGLLFVGLQPIVSVCMAMTKADVKKYVIELISLSYIRTKPSQAT